MNPTTLRVYSTWATYWPSCCGPHPWMAICSPSAWRPAGLWNSDPANPNPSQLYVHITLPSVEAFLPTIRLVQAKLCPTTANRQAMVNSDFFIFNKLVYSSLRDNRRRDATNVAHHLPESMQWSFRFYFKYHGCTIHICCFNDNVCRHLLLCWVFAMFFLEIHNK